MGKNIKTVQVMVYWNETIWKKEKDSKIVIKYITIKFRKTSKFKVVIKTRVDDKIAYLFLLTQPTVNIRKEKNIAKTPINNRLYSISHIAKFGAHIRFNQNK